MNIEASVSLALLLLVFVVVPGLIVFAMVRLVTSSNSYHESGSGNGGPVLGALMEIDRITRPSIEHVQEIKENNQSIARQDLAKTNLANE